MAPCKCQEKAKRNLTCSSCDSWVDFAKSGCVNSWVEVQADEFKFVCCECKTVTCLQEQANELRQMILMMTGQGEKEDSRGGENEESIGNVRENAGKKKEDGKRKSVQQREDKRVSGEGLSGGKIVEDVERREKGKTVDQKKKDSRRQSVQQKRDKRVSGEGLPSGKTVEVDGRGERGHSMQQANGKPVMLQERSFTGVVSQGKARNDRIFMGDSIIRKSR